MSATKPGNSKVVTRIALWKPHHSLISECKLRLAQIPIFSLNFNPGLTILDGDVADSFRKVAPGRVGVTLAKKWSFESLSYLISFRPLDTREKRTANRPAYLSCL